ncbi:MAG: DUF364 domain-containing protein [Proteobacteria bacterium]|nr:DUF364 domain-containing protein [Pseudomonadota bacterium]
MEVLNALLGQGIPALPCTVSLYPYVVFAESIRPGLATNVAAGRDEETRDVAAFQKLTTADLAHLILSPAGLEAAIGMAALNSALDVSPIENRLQQVNAFDVLLKRGKNKNMSIIGHFLFVEQLKKAGIARNLWVFELKPKTGDDLLPEHIPEYVPESDIVLMSGTTLIHHSFDAIRKYFSKSYNMMVGPSTPLSPVLFEFGIHMISGTLVSDAALAKKSFSAGAKFREARGLRFVSFFRDRLKKPSY